MRGAGEGLRWAACELHAHSIHSDGRLGVAELARYAAGRGLDLIALSDHNTVSGLAEAAALGARYGAEILSAMELTTFYGHILALGVQDYVEWRVLGREGAGRAVAEIRSRGGLAGIAHPFRPGSPFCTGCFWEFEGFEPGEADYLELWSEPDPHLAPCNARAFELWTSLLDRGFRVAATSGTDYHGPGREGLCATTFLGCEPGPGALGGAAVEALRRGRAAVSLGPRPALELGPLGEGRAYGPGDALPPGQGRLEARASLLPWRGAASRLPELRAESARFLWRGGSTEADLAPDPEAGGALAAQVELPPSVEGYLRVEFRGSVRGEPALIGFTNPLYLGGA